MKNTAWPRLLVLAAALASTSVVACSLILDKNKDQCATNGDCAKFGAGFTCNAGVCSKPTTGTDSSVDPDGALPDGALPDGGCVPKVPKSSREDFLNEACTDSTCVPFDNCARLGLCGDATLPALVDPPDGGV
jgi:hypothetical protein